MMLLSLLCCRWLASGASGAGGAGIIRGSAAGGGRAGRCGRPAALRPASGPAATRGPERGRKFEVRLCLLSVRMSHEQRPPDHVVSAAFLHAGYCMHGSRQGTRGRAQELTVRSQISQRSPQSSTLSTVLARQHSGRGAGVVAVRRRRAVGEGEAERIEAAQTRR